MRLVEVARTRAHQVIQPCVTESYSSMWAEFVNVTSGLETREIPVDFFTLFSIIACVILVWIVILVVVVTCPPQLNSCSKNKHLLGRRRACITPGLAASRGYGVYEKRFLFVDTSGRTRVVSKVNRAGDEEYRSESSKTSRSTTTSVSSKSSSRSSRSLRRSSEARETSDDTLVPLYDLIEDDDKGSTNERLKDGNAKANVGESQTKKPVRDPQPFGHYAKCRKDARQRQPPSEHGQLNNKCKCQLDLLPLLRHKICCAGGATCEYVCSKGREFQRRDKTQRRNCTNDPSFPASDSAPLDNVEDSSHFDMTVGSTSRIYRLPSFSQSTIKNAESCDEDALFPHSASQTPSIDTDPSSQSSWDKTRQRQLLQETFLCSTRSTPVQQYTPIVPMAAPYSSSDGAYNKANTPSVSAPTRSSDIRSHLRTPINGTHHPEWDNHPMHLPHNGHSVNGFPENYFRGYNSNRCDNRRDENRTPDYVNEIAQNTCAPYRSYQFIELNEKGSEFSPREDVAMDLKPSDFFGLQCCTLPNHIRSRDRYHRESELVYDVPKQDAATSRNSRTPQTHEARVSSFGPRLGGFDIAKDRIGTCSIGGASNENVDIKLQGSRPVFFAAQPSPGASQIDAESVTSAKLVRETCRLRPGESEEKEPKSGKITSEPRPNINAQRVSLPPHSTSYDEEYVDMSQPLLRYYTVNYHKSNNGRLPNTLH